MMGDRMAADRRELLGRQTADFAPIHEGLVEDRARTDPVTAAKLGGGGRLLVRRHGHEPAKEPIEGLALLGDRTGGKRRPASPGDRLGPGNRLLQNHPPRLGGAIDEAGRDIDRERRAARLEDRQRLFEIVAVAVVEGERDEASAGRTGQALQRFVKADDVKAPRPHPVDHGGKVLRRHLEMGVRGEGGGAPRPHPVEREDRSAPAGEGRDRAVESGHPQAVENGLAERRV